MTDRAWKSACPSLVLALLAGGLAGPLVPPARAQQPEVVLPADSEVEGCGNLKNAFGPKDYRTISTFDRNLVEGAHFTTDVETLKAGITGTVGSEIDYTLRAIPNHPRALMSMSRLGEKLKTDKAPQARYSVDCYFQRAIAFTPDDGNVHMVFGLHLLRKDKYREAIAELERARELSGGNANIHYNLGLAYFAVGETDRALTEAKAAYELGFPLPGLRDKLKRAGKWTE